MKLSHAAITKAIAEAVPRKLFDGGGMYLEITKTGSAAWRLKYRYGGKEKRISLGRWPDTSLALARSKRDKARQQLAEGLDPSEMRQQEKATAAGTDTFETVAWEWYGQQKETWAPSHSITVQRRLERDVTPYIGKVPVGDLTAPQVLEVLRRVEARGALETAKRIRVVISQVMSYAVAIGMAQHDPAAPLGRALKPAKVEHFRAPLDPAEVGRVLVACDAYVGSPIVRAALTLQPLTVARPGELRTMRWADVDLEAAEWRYEASKTKAQHVVPLPEQAVAALRELEPLTRDASEYVLHSDRARQRPMSSGAALAAYRRLGLGDVLVGHSWRSIFLTHAVETLGAPREHAEMQLAHRMQGPLGRAYARMQWLAERRELLQQWANLLDTWRAEATKRAKAESAESPVASGLNESVPATSTKG